MARTLKVGDPVRVSDRIFSRGVPRVIFRSGCTILSLRDGYVEVQFPPRKDRKGRDHSPRGWVTDSDVTLERDVDENSRGRS
jgi:hypothetical protein